MTREQVATAIRRVVSLQVEDIERAVRDGHKTIALNELADLNRQLKAFAAALKKAPARI
ncbi:MULTISPECIES: hypothetical protein [Methylobacterium]|jgi:hypothetical protein|uniref:Uncharacterized protein n=1 Tax=Methylobacterium brachiatum TaxID=269660 RepID=A0AAJ1TU45_9HYPH|nr:MULTISPECIES: hypothetical protein [Methylobacterium]EIZ81446.1 hypothetical protein WYO_5908 [Methylobacterium sp. GXF4]MCB4805685.1 hypothetical protein [Methylobacterium brachiatum]MCJ2056483.1 hypothetical protein [Methylobacterium sp. J-048]MCJ2093713.1 hypothetical protein [Methylobacterium sp. J-072]MCJ2121618.1 hypothetical protein [Methylobacterium sp. J-077]